MTMAAAQAATATKEETPKTETAKPASSAGDLAVFQRPRLGWHPAIEQSFGDIGVTKATWKALIDAVFPAAKSVDSVILALSYCKARKLDPFKRPVHIVPIWSKEEGRYVDTVWPGISELRTTAVRTGTFAGTDPAIFGPDVTRTFTGRIGKGDRARDVSVTLTFPEWCQVTGYRMIDGTRVAITGPRVYWEETYATIGNTEVPNEMWQRRRRGQIEKCAEAGMLRRAFPEELGSEYTADEAEGGHFYAGTTIDATALKPTPPADSANAALDGLVDRATQQPAHDPETGEIVEEQKPEEQTQEVQVDQATADAETMVANAIKNLADPELKTVELVDEYAARIRDAIKALEIAEDAKTVLLGRFTNEVLSRKRDLAKKPAGKK